MTACSIIMRRHVVGVTMWLLVMLPACRRVSLKPSNLLQNIETVAIPAHYVERELVDISLPLGATIKEFNCLSECTVVVCECHQYLRDIVDFYKIDNEQLGWHVLSQCVSAHHASIVSEKPHRMCLIIARPAGPECVMVEIHVVHKLLAPTP